MSESPYSKVKNVKNVVKKRLSRKYCKVFQKTSFTKYLRTAASETHLINTKLFIKLLLCKIMLSFIKYIHKEKCGIQKIKKSVKNVKYKISYKITK